MQERTNLAYRQAEKAKPEIEGIRQVVSKPQPRSFPWKGVLYVLSLALMMSGIVFTKMNQIEVTQSCSSVKREVQELKNQNEWLKRQLDQVLSQESLTAFAQNEMQMQRMDSGRVEYIHFEEEPKAEVIATVSGWRALLGWLQGLFA